MPTKIEKDAISGTDTTGHEWDGIKELNTPLPRWWVLVFYATIVWALIWSILYPSWPGLSGYFHGVLGYSTRAGIEQKMADVAAQRAPMLDKIKAAGFADIEKDPNLLNFAIGGGKAVFADNCAPCHGPGGGGSKGFPNLAGDDWLWGGSIDQIYQTISYGIRSGNPKAHESTMVAFGKDGVLKRGEIVAVARYVRSLSGLPVPSGTDLGAGKKIFDDNCASCHGDDGKGNPEIGAPNLADKIWLYGPDETTIVDVITNGRNGVMPAWVDRLDPATIKALAVYVHSLGGGQ